jgi:hypothetical protein
MPNSTLLSTRLHPFLGRHDGPHSRLGLDLKGVHDARRPWQAEPQRPASGVMIPEGRLGVVEARALVDGLDLDTSAAPGGIFKPGHQQMTPAAAIFEDVAPEFRGNGRYHGHFRNPERRLETLVELNIHHGSVKISLCLNVIAAERRPVRIRVRVLVEVRVRIRHG